MAATDDAVRELDAMLDEGVHVELAGTDGSEFLLRVVLDDAECADCLVPDETLQVIAKDALERRGVTVSTLAIEHVTP